MSGRGGIIWPAQGTEPWWETASSAEPPSIASGAAHNWRLETALFGWGVILALALLVWLVAEGCRRLPAWRARRAAERARLAEEEAARREREDHVRDWRV